MKNIILFRYGHRLERDKRVTTHCGLVSRAFGANEMFYSGQEDNTIEDNINSITERFGGTFKVSYEKNYMKKLEELKKTHKIIHLTMYGLNFKEFEKTAKKLDKVVIVIGSQKVPKEIYDIADYNISVANQPHSEIAALAITLDRLNPQYLDKDFDKKNFKGKIKITPSNEGKIVKY